MQKYEFFDDGNDIGCHPSMEPQPATIHGVAVFYLASDVDARIADLSDACRQKQECIDYAKSRIAELERLLDVERRATAAAQEQADKASRWEAEANRLGERVAELEKALRHFAKFPLEDFGWQTKGPEHPITGFNSWKLQVGHIAIARKALGVKPPVL